MINAMTLYSAFLVIPLKGLYTGAIFKHLHFKGRTNSEINTYLGRQPEIKCLGQDYINM